MPQRSQSASPEQVFTTFGLHRAITATIRFGSDVVLSAKERKDQKYRQYLGERHDALLAEFEYARSAFDHASAARDDPTTGDDLAVLSRLNRKYLQANNRLSKAEREYHVFLAEHEQLQSIPSGSWSRVEAQAFDDDAIKAQMEREEAAVEARVGDRYKRRINQVQEEKRELEESHLELSQQLRNAHLRASQLETEKHEALMAVRIILRNQSTGLHHAPKPKTPEPQPKERTLAELQREWLAECVKEGYDENERNQFSSSPRWNEKSSSSSSSPAPDSQPGRDTDVSALQEALLGWPAEGWPLK